MRYDTIEFRNFASYGNRDQVIDLSGKPGFYLIMGKNGTGKSTISDVIEFGPYGKVDGKNIKDLANRSNRNGWVRVNMTTKNHKIGIERTIAPNSLELTVDGVPYDKSKYNGTGPNEYLNDELLDIPFYVFTNIISLTINDFKSFMTMGAKDKREIVDRVLGYSILNEMREILNKSSKSLKDSLDVLGGKLEGARMSLDSSMLQLDATIKKLQENNDDQVKQTAEDLERFREVMKIHLSKITEFKDRKAQVDGEITKYTGLMSNAKSAMLYAQNRLKLFDNHKCPECGIGLDSEFHVSLKTGLESDLDRASKEYDKLVSEALVIKGNKQKVDDEERALLSKGSTIQEKIRTLASTLSVLQSSKDDLQAEGLRNVINKVNAEMLEWSNQRAIDEEKLSWNRVVESAVGENGIKRLVMQRIIPPFNNEIAAMMLQLYLDYTVTFDENFDATLFHLGEEIPHSSLSFGESKKIDFAILVAWIRLMKIKFPTLNVLFLDELFSSIDTEGIHSILQILQKLCQELDLNIFVISHNPLPQEVFDYKILIDKKDGFSNLHIEAA